MGYYVNPPNMAKDAWLDDNGERINSPLEFNEAYKDGKMNVVLIDNRAFKAAAVCYSVKELQELNNPSDIRGKEWYLVPIDALKKIQAIPQNF